MSKETNQAAADPGESREQLIRELADARSRLAAQEQQLQELSRKLDGLQTRERSIEETLRESDERFRMLLSASSEVLYRMSPDWSEMRQLTSKGFLADTARPSRNWLQEYIHPDDQPAVTAAIDEAIRTRSAFVFEHRVRRADGSLGWTFSRAVPLLDAGSEIVEWFGAASDITERKRFEEALQRSEQQLAKELESTRNLQQVSTRLIQAEDLKVLYEDILDTAAAILQADFASLQMLDPERGAAGELRLLGHRGFSDQAARFWEWVRPDSQTTCGRCLSTGQRVVVPDIRACGFMAGSQDLQTYLRTGILAVQTTPLISRSGTLLGALSTHWREPHTPTPGELRNLDILARQAADLIDRKQADAALRHLNETLEQQVAERTELAERRARQLHYLAVELIEAEERIRWRIAEMLHEDLQQVLASARMQLQMVRPTLPPEPILEHVERMLLQAIDTSRSLSQELSPSILYHSDLATALRWLSRRKKEKFGLSVELQTDDPLPVKETPIHVFVFRAVQELLVNVVQHAEVKNARVDLSIHENTLSVTVSDDGRGFDPTVLEIATAKGGLGLLSLRERASYIGGRLLIESAPGNGSRVTLTVPLAIPDAGALQAAAVEPETPIVSEAAHTGTDGDLRVLFVDDHQVMRQGLIKLISGKPGIQVAGEAANGREALERVRRLEPDVVVMDISMPEMDGIEATRRIKTEFPNVRVVGLSMHDNAQIFQTMRDAGAESVVSKAASSAELLRSIYSSFRTDQCRHRRRPAPAEP